MSASCALALKVAAAKAAVSATACRALHIAAVLVGIGAIRRVGRRVRWPAVRWVIGLRVVRVVVWGSRRGTKSGPCRDTIFGKSSRSAVRLSRSRLRNRWFADLYGSFSVKWFFGL